MVCRCGEQFDESLGVYGCPNCEGASGKARTTVTPEQIKALRESLGLSQQGLADRINEIDPLLRVNRQTVYRWEGGKPTQAPSPHALAALQRLQADAA